MIILLLGGIGSGKSLSVIKEIMRNKESFAISNFKLNLTASKFYRLKLSDIIKEVEKTQEKESNKKPEKILSVNWKFWDEMRKKHKYFSIYLDEVHNLIHSRASMSKRNILMSKWISQIRKILADKPNNHIYMISQTLRKVDVDFRELAQVIIECSKIQIGEKVFILQKYYDGIDNYLTRNFTYKTCFLGNRFFKFYNTEEMVTFSDAEDYV